MLEPSELTLLFLYATYLMTGIRCVSLSNLPYFKNKMCFSMQLTL